VYTHGESKLVRRSLIANRVAWMGFASEAQMSKPSLVILFLFLSLAQLLKLYKKIDSKHFKEIFSTKISIS
jgi:predicted ABC-type exoprotein transport system permease subunit